MCGIAFKIVPSGRRFYASVRGRRDVNKGVVRLDIEHEGQRWLIEGDLEEVLKRIGEELNEDLLKEILASTETEEKGGAVSIFNALLEGLSFFT